MLMLILTSFVLAAQPSRDLVTHAEPRWVTVTRAEPRWVTSPRAAISGREAATRIEPWREL
ncbi:MAG: hypothetical protein NVSMB25_07180 [Thermoleophilaceae bacterium]